MSTEYSGNPANYPATVTLPSDGDADAATVLNNGVMDLADRTAYYQASADAHAVLNWKSTASVIASGAITGGCYANVARVWGVVGGVDQCSLSSDDGATWSASATGMASSITLYDIASDGTSATAVGASATAYRRTTINSGSWTTITMPGSPTALTRIVSKGGKWIVVGMITGTQPYVATSNDGNTWTTRTAPAGMAGFELMGLAFSGAGGVAVMTAYGARTKVSFSTDNGATWTDCATTLTSGTYQVTWNPWLSLFFICNCSGAGGPIYSSPDGNTWTQRAASVPIQTSLQPYSRVLSSLGTLVVVTKATAAPDLSWSADWGTTWNQNGQDTGTGSLSQMIHDWNAGKLLVLGGNTSLSQSLRIRVQP